MNHSVLDVEGQVLSISQFTLYGDCRKEDVQTLWMPKPDYAERLYDFFNEEVRKQGLHVETGKFGAMMDVSLINDGPVTLIVESNSVDKKRGLYNPLFLYIVVCFVHLFGINSSFGYV